MKFLTQTFLGFFLLFCGVGSLKAQGTIQLDVDGFYKQHNNSTPALFKIFYSFDTGALVGTEIYCTDVVNANQGFHSFPTTINIPYPTNPPNAIKLFVSEWTADAPSITSYQNICGGMDVCSSVWCSLPYYSTTHIIDFTTIGPGFDSEFDFQVGGSTGMKGRIRYLLPSNPFTNNTKVWYNKNGLASFAPYKPTDLLLNLGTGHCYGENSKEFKFVPQIIPVPNNSGIQYVWEYSYQINFASPVSTYTSPWIEAGTSTAGYLSGEHMVGDIFEMPGLLNELYTRYISNDELLTPRLTIQVYTKYGPGLCLTTNTYTLFSNDPIPTSDIKLNYPPAVDTPVIPTFAAGSNPVASFTDAVSGSPSLSVEHIKCIENTNSGRIILKNPQGLAGKYYAYIRRTGGGFVDNKIMDFRGANVNNTYSFDNLAVGDYELIIENFGIVTGGSGEPSYTQNGCYSELVHIFINAPSSKVGFTSVNAPTKIGGVHVSCRGASDGVIDIVVDGGVPNYYFKLFKKDGVGNWIHQPKSTDNVLQTKIFSFSGLSAGEYQIEVQDVFKENSCTVQSSAIMLTEPSELTANAQGNQPYTDAIDETIYEIKSFGGTETIFITPDGGTANYQVQINGGTPVAVASGNSASQSLSAGNHTYFIQDANNCNKAGNFILKQPNDITLASQNITHVNCNGGSDGAISGSPQGGIRSSVHYSYTLTKPSQAGFNQTNTGANFNFSGLTAGIYELKVEDKYFTSKIFSFVVNEPSLIAVLTTTGHKPYVSCVGGADGVIALSVSGGTAPYAYEYSNNGGASWSPLANTSGTLTISTLPAGNYEVRLRDSKGCFNQDASGYIRQNITIDAPVSALNLVLTPEHLLCKGDNSGKIYLVGSGGWGSYSFFDASTNAPVSTTITGLSAGTYNYKVRDVRGCEYTASITLTEPTELAGSSITTSPTLCFGEASGSMSISVSGGTAPYQVSVDGGALQAYTSGNTIVGLSAGNHTIRIVDANGCEKTYPLTITDAPEIIINTLSQTAANCGQADGTVSVSVSGGTGAGTYTYTWRNSSNVVVGTNSNVLSGVASGAYTVTTKDANNCEKQYVAIVPSADGPQGVANVLQTVSCFGGNDGVANIHITGGQSPYSVLWANGQTSTGITTSATMSGLPAGTQIAQITDAGGCIQPVSFSISQPASALVINVVSNISPTCHQGSDGSIEIIGIGGTAPYTYLWLDNNSTSVIRNGLKAGSYSIQITDSKNCTTTQAILVTEPTPVTAAFSEASFTICPNQTLSLDAGNAGSTYLWKKIETGTTISNSQQAPITEAGEYELTITTPQGCVGKKTFAVNISNDALKAEFLAATEIEVGDTLVVIDVTNPAPSEVVWSYDMSNPNISRIDNQSTPYYAHFVFSEAGTYVITMQVRLFGCVSTMHKTITVLPKTGRVAHAGLGYQGVGEISTLLVYPNPSNGVFKTKVELVEKAPIEVLLYGLQNRESYFKAVREGAKEYEVEVALPDLPAGNYVLVVKTPQMVKTQQIVISR